MSKIIQTLLLVIIILNSISILAEEEQKIYLIATTTMIKSVLYNIGKDKVEIEVITPMGMCPGHFDVKPHHIKVMQKSLAIFYHGWEPWMKALREKLYIDENKFYKLENNGSITVPENYILAVKEATEVLIKIKPEYKEYFVSNSFEYINKVKDKVKEIEKKISDIKGKPVICSEQLKSFLSWLDINVVKSYRRAEELSPREIMNLIDIVRKNKVMAVIDNLQSGSDIGKIVSSETGVVHIVLSNFPEDNSYIKLLDDSINSLRKIR